MTLRDTPTNIGDESSSAVFERIDKALRAKSYDEMLTALKRSDYSNMIDAMFK